jgi:hypothetical protein
MPSAGGVASVGSVDVAAPERLAFDAAVKSLFASPLLELPRRTEPLFPDYEAARAAIAHSAASDCADPAVDALAASVSATALDGCASDAMEEEDCDMEGTGSEAPLAPYTYPTTSDDPDEAALIAVLQYFRNVLVVPDELDPTDRRCSGRWHCWCCSYIAQN